jgi:hypothetical protein
VDTVRDLPQFIQRGPEPGRQQRQLTLNLVRGPGCHRLDSAGFQRERDEALLDAVVQVTLEPPPGLVGGGDNPGA